MAAAAGPTFPPRLVVIGASWGGLAALRTILPQLPADLAACVAVVQHRSSDSMSMAYQQILQKICPLEVIEADDKEPVRDGVVVVAPPDYHMLVEGEHFALTTDVRVQFARPSIDVLFETAADAWGNEVLAAVLTGANDDGANGVRCVRERGGYVIVQDPGSADRHEMPAAAVATGMANEVLPLSQIGWRIADLCGANSDTVKGTTS